MISREGRLKEEFTTEIEKLKNLINDIENSTEKHSLLEDALRKSQKKYETLFDIIPFGIIELDSDGQIIDTNSKTLKMLDSKREDVLGKRLADINKLNSAIIKEYKDFPKYIARNEIQFSEEINIKNKTGQNQRLEFNYYINREENIIKNVYLIINDTTRRKKIEEEVKYLRFHDNLTGLFNRSYFEEEIKRLNTARQLPLSIIIGDINGLKVINDAFGNSEGDRLLKIVAEIFRKACRKEDIISRYGEDEFAVLLPETSEELTNGIIHRIRKMCGKISKEEFPFILSLGNATKLKREEDFNEIIISAKNEMYRDKLITGKSTPGGVVFSLVDSLLENGYETREHTKRVEKMAGELGQALKLSKSEIDELSILASLHDLGKVAIPDNILKEKEKLSKEDWEVIKSYPEIGYNIAKSSFKFSNVADYILHHHERWDGLGYPMKLKGEDIPLLSRIMAIVDAYDVMRTGRFYKSTFSKRNAIQELRKCSGKQFDPKLVEEFISIIGDEDF